MPYFKPYELYYIMYQININKVSFVHSKKALVFNTKANYIEP